jgi:hypothetical protein
MDNEDIRVVPGDESGAGDTVREFRDSLDTRRDAEDVMAAALQARQQAAAYADEIIRHSEALAIEIEEEARESARIATTEAKRRAEQILTDALVNAEHTAAEAEAAAEKTRHEKEQHSAAVDEHTSSTIRRLESAAGEVLLALDRAKADLIDAMVPLAALRSLDSDDPVPVEREAVGSDRHQHDRRRNPFRSVH